MEERRSLPKIVVNSRAQLRTAVPFLILLILSMGLFVFTYFEVIGAMHDESARLTPERIETLTTLETIANRVMIAEAFGMFLMSFSALVLWLIYSHRIFGPTVPLRRHISLLCEGNYDSKITLRQHDEFHDIADDLNRLTAILKNQRGQSLVQVMVAAAIMGVLMLAMTSMLATQSKENRALVEKLASGDLYRILSSTLANPSTCFAQLAGANLVSASSLTFDASTVSAAHPFTIDMKEITAGNSGSALISLGDVASPMSKTLVVQTSSGIQLSVTSDTTANLLINFDQAKLVRGLHDLVLPLTLQTSGAANAKTIVGCGGTGANTAIFFGNLAGPSTATQVMCPPSTRLITCSIRSYSNHDGQGFPELQQVTYLDANGSQAPTTFANAGSYVVPTGSVNNPQGCSYFNIDNQDSAQISATCE